MSSLPSNFRLPSLGPSAFRTVVLFACLFLAAAASAADPAKSGPLREAQAAFEQREYGKVLDLTKPLVKEGKQAVEALRLRVRAYQRLGNPRDALADYDQLVEKTGKDDPALLRDIAMALILPLLKDMREQMRGAGYTALKEIQTDDTVPYFLDGLSDGSGLVRALAAEGLGRLKPGPHTAGLKKALDDQAAIVRAAGLKALGRSRDHKQIPAIEKALGDEQASVRIAALGVLVMLGRTEAWEKISEAAEASNPDDRAAALRMLGDLGDRRALPILKQALGHPQPSVRGAAAMALGDLGDPAAAPALSSLLNDPIPAVRAAAAVSLGEVAAPDAGPELKKVLADPNPAVRAATVSALLHLAVPFSDVAGTVRELTGHADPGIRASAGKALSRSRGENREEAVEVLRVLLEDPLPRPKIAAARALGQLAGHAKGKQQRHEIIGILKPALHDQDEAVRGTAGGAVIKALNADASGQEGK